MGFVVDVIWSFFFCLFTYEDKKDTVKLQGQGFEPKVKQGDKVNVGENLITLI